MRYHFIAICTVASLPVFAAANAVRRQAACNTGVLLCCNQIEDVRNTERRRNTTKMAYLQASSSFGSAILALLGLAPGSITGTLGLTCSPITIASATGTGCSAQLVCCENNNFFGYFENPKFVHEQVMLAPVTGLLILPILAAASGIPRQASNQCNTGFILCCNQVEPANSSIASAILTIFQIAPGSVTGLIGLTCSPISVIGVSGNSCSAQPVCCTDNSHNGVIALGCTPLNLNL
ncbi:hypothetical protein CVT25_014155 [Psilocybe cyanescens]|uniref:Hydrophobin n=1 Tax=Psilocybe cyanescens TaxID=93625 RepID=A0A409XUY2_PSICY|nr:hypothetical protein CVT25_014155 [Psilocybe cyanescens]